MGISSTRASQRTASDRIKRESQNERMAQLRRVKWVGVYRVEIRSSMSSADPFPIL